MNTSLVFGLLLIAMSLLILSCERASDAQKPVEVSEAISKSESQIYPHIPFKDATKEMGLNFTHHNGAKGDKWYPEQFVGGAGFFDYNRDGYADIVAVRFHNSLSKTDQKNINSIVVYKNNAGKSFSDVTEELGLQLENYAFGVFSGDYDNDGWDDLYITSYGQNKLFKNNLGQSFVDVTEKMFQTQSLSKLSIPAIFVDVDNDDDLDLLVGNNVSWSTEIEKPYLLMLNGKTKGYLGPKEFSGSSPVLYINEYPAKFRSVRLGDWSQSNVENEVLPGKALGLQLLDINQDGFLDVFVANDQVRNFMLMNRHGQGFDEQAEILGLAYDNLGQPTGAMGVDVAWVDHTTNLAVGNYAAEMSTIYRQNDNGGFHDVAALIGIGASSREKVTFGVAFEDFDLDGNVDYLQVNGHIDPDIKKSNNLQEYRQAAQMYWQCVSGCKRRFVELGQEYVGDILKPIVGRALATADIDHDGDVDILVSSLQETMRLFRNEQKLGNQWLKVKLVRQDNKPVVGTTVEIYRPQEGYQKRVVSPNRGYLSISDSVLTFGMGKSDLHSSKLVVTWPNSRINTICNPKLNSIVVIRESLSSNDCK